MEIKKTDIEKMEILLIEAIKKSDTHFLDKTIHNDFVDMAPDVQTITKHMDLASHQAGEMVVEELILTLEDIHILGDTALSTIIYESRGKMLGQSIAGKYKYLRVWKKFDEGKNK